MSAFPDYPQTPEVTIPEIEVIIYCKSCDRYYIRRDCEYQAIDKKLRGSNTHIKINYCRTHTFKKWRIVPKEGGLDGR